MQLRIGSLDSTLFVAEDMVPYAIQQSWLQRMMLVVDPEYQVPPPVTFPADMHPLPDDIDAYCVYSYRAEDLVRTSPNLSSSRFRAMRSEQESFLKEKQLARERRERERLQKMAPGWAHHGDARMILEPTRVPTTSTKNAATNKSSGSAETKHSPSIPSSTSSGALSKGDEDLATSLESLRTA